MDENMPFQVLQVGSSVLNLNYLKALELELESGSTLAICFR